MRRGGPVDVEPIRRLAMTTFTEAFGVDLPPQAFQALLDERFTEAQFQAELADPAFAYAVAEDRDGFQGYAVIHAAAAPVPTTAPAFELCRIYVRTDLHGTGLGQALMEACLSEIFHRGGRSVWLKVWAGNLRARAFYRRWGFQERGRENVELPSVMLEHLILVRDLEDEGIA